MDAFIDVKDGNVDMKQSINIVESPSAAENQPSDEVAVAFPTDPIPIVEHPEAVEKDPHPASAAKVAVEHPAEEFALEKYISKKQTETIKSDTKNQNGTDLLQASRAQMEKLAVVPNDDSPVVSSMPEEKPADSTIDDELSPDEKRMTQIEEVGISKAEFFIKLKKSGGKLVYDRAYLMKLRECATSQIKPVGLPECIAMDKVIVHCSQLKYAPAIGKSSKQGRQRPGDMPVPSSMIRSISMSKYTQAPHQSESLWNHSKKEDKDGVLTSLIQNNWEPRKKVTEPMERDNPMFFNEDIVRNEEFKQPARPITVKQMSKSEIETKARNIIVEYLNIQDLADAKLSVKELAGQRHLYLVVTACIISVLKKRDDARNMTGNFFHELVSGNILTSDMYIKGLSEVLQYVSDVMVDDMSTLWSCLAQLINPLLVGGSLQWPMLKQALSPHLDNKEGAKLLASILSQCAEKQGEKEVAECWEKSGLHWSTYLKANELTTFVNDKNLGFTLELYQELSLI